MFTRLEDAALSGWSAAQRVLNELEA
jgi:hypothetical protein